MLQLIVGIIPFGNAGTVLFSLIALLCIVGNDGLFRFDSALS